MLEIDGPKQACFESLNGSVVYRTLALGGKSPNDLVKVMYGTIERIKELAGSDAVLYWRRRPELVEENDDSTFKKLKVVCRLAVYPDLSEEIWSTFRYVKPEGESPKC